MPDTCSCPPGARCAHAARHNHPGVVETEPDKAYRDRSELLAVLAASMPAQLVFGADPNAPGWPVLFIDLPSGQASWHINPNDTDLFPMGLWRNAGDDDVMVWDGHSDREKSGRLLEFATVLHISRKARQ